MNIEPMSTPNTREEFEYRFHLLQERMRKGKMKFSRGVSRGIDGLREVRYLPNGRIDFLSVNESARLIANMQLQMQQTTANFSSQSKEE